MTDQTIPAGLTRDEAQAVREWAERSLTVWDPDKPVAKAARVVLAALPSPPRPTLADMSDAERRELTWMQADTEPWGRVVIILPKASGGRAVLLDRWGDVTYEDHANVTPRPDLPRMEWPGDKEPAPAPALPDGWRLADHPEHGRVIVTNTTPNRDGYVYVVLPAADQMGYDWHLFTPDELTYIDQEDDQ